MPYKKILFLDTTLHKKDATGITLSNLFGQWPKEKLYMIGDAANVSLSKSDGFTNTYILGNDELKHAFPLGLLKLLVLKFRKATSIGLHASPDTNREVVHDVKHSTVRKSSKLLTSVQSLPKKLFLRLGLDHLLFRCIVSDKLNKWISDADPDFFYALLSNRHSILFALEITKKYNKPLIIHILDDWPASIGSDTIFPDLWNKKINLELKELLKLSFRQFAISDAMACEYNVRFGGKWNYFHNPIDYSKWRINNQDIKTIQKKGLVKISYFGRIGRANDNSIKRFIEILNEINKQKAIIEFHIYSNNIPLDNIYKKSFLYFHKFITHELMPQAINLYDFLLLPLSFKKEDIQFSRLSIPTKFSEYLASGIPIILFAPEETALHIFTTKNNCALIIDSKDDDINKQKLIEQLTNNELCELVSNNGQRLAQNELDISVIGKKFKTMFLEQ